MLEVRDLCKAFGGVEAVRHASLSAERGERRVLLGPNGAGKTTLFNLIAGDLRADRGAVLIDGVAVDAMSIHRRARMGLSRSHQKNALFDGLSVRENLLLAAAAGRRKTLTLFRDAFQDREIRRIVEEIAERMRLDAVLDAPTRSASYGVRRQLEIAIALAFGPRILLMDEPTSGIGPAMTDDFRNMLLALPEDLTVLIIEHDLDLAFAVADRVTVLDFGETAFEGTPEEARASPIVRAVYLGERNRHARL